MLCDVDEYVAVDLDELRYQFGSGNANTELSASVVAASDTSLIQPRRHVLPLVAQRLQEALLVRRGRPGKSERRERHGPGDPNEPSHHCPTGRVSGQRYCRAAGTMP